MKLDRRGDIGFLEAMAGAMTVCLVLMAFLSFLAADHVQDNDGSISFDERLLEHLVLSENSCHLDEDNALSGFIEDNSLRGLSVRVYFAGNSNGFETVYEKGSVTADRITQRLLITVDSAEGYSVPVVAEVLMCR